ncbi:MAG: ExbD/TolR family protein [Candidatus Margulisiibacteriota bacterium]
MRKTHHIRLEIIPIIDVMFTLLIFFIMYTAISIHAKGMKLNLPHAASVTQEKQGLVLTILNDKEVLLNDTPVSVEDLQKTISVQTQPDRSIQILVNADKTMPYGTVMNVLDAVRQGGCYNIVLKADKKTPHDEK